MKRLVFCFDGSWNRLDAPFSTNVVITAESVLPIASNGIAQAIFYDEGVGTRKGEKLSGGMFGQGIVQNLGDAYRFLIFNYTPGDEIYVFGFSRGAYTARSFAGLLSTCGILRRGDAAKVTDAVLLYQQRKPNDSSFDAKMMGFRRDYSPQVCVSDEEDHWRSQNVAGYKAGSSPQLRITYLGVWDAYHLLDACKQLPGMEDDGSADGAKLQNWIVEARQLCATHGREEIGDQMIGQLLAKSPVGSDGIWPHESVREVLEVVGTSNIARGMAVARYNARGAYFRARGGNEEREIAKQYRDSAKRLRFDAPFTTRMLEDLASSYDHEAVMHDEDSDLQKRVID